MAVRKEYVGLNEDGSPHFAYISDDPNDHLVVTGPIYGVVHVDGEAIDVSENVIAVDSHAKALKVADAIGERHQTEGHSSFLKDPLVPDNGFVHIPTSVSHDKDGKVTAAFAEAVRTVAVPAGGSHPQAVLDHLNSKKKG